MHHFSQGLLLGSRGQNCEVTLLTQTPKYLGLLMALLVYASKPNTHSSILYSHTHDVCLYQAYIMVNKQQSPTKEAQLRYSLAHLFTGVLLSFHQERYVKSTKAIHGSLIQSNSRCRVQGPQFMMALARHLGVR